MQWAKLLADGVHLLQGDLFARPKRSVAAHVYMGISYHGVTSLKFCDW